MNPIIENLANLYPALKKQEKMHDIYRGILEEKFEEENAEIKTYQGMVFHYKKHTNWSWRESIYDILEDEYKLPLAVSITKPIEERFEISEFLLPSESSSIRLYAGGGKSKLVVAAEKERIKELENELRQQSFEHLASQFIVNKLDLMVSEQKYDRLKKQLYNHLIENDLPSISSPMGTFKIVNSKQYHDVQKIAFSDIEKKQAFLTLPLEDGIHMLNLYTGSTHILDEQTQIEGHWFWYENGDLFCDDQFLSLPYMVIDHKKEILSTMQNWIAQGAKPHYGKVTIEGMHFFRHCPISSVKLDDLLDRGLIEEKLIHQNRFCAKEEDLQLRFEVIDESSLIERKNMLHNKIMKRSQMLRDQQNPEMDQMDEDIFASQ